ncbi:MAG: DUF4956 domain-containing protein [Lachnospiraceae bacterium]|nr:DUF4956 domain-containing protein [Lachnospiraceae bacterium]
MLDSIMMSPITLQPLLICLGTAMVLGVLTALVFSFKSRSSASFSLTLALLPMTVCMIIMMVNENIGTGVAVAGAFALIRFRSVPGTAREIAAIFTTMALGLSLGMGYVGVAFLFFAFVAVLTLLLTQLDFGGASRTEKQLKITIPENFNYDGLFDDIFQKYQVDVTLEKIRTTNMGTLYELTYQARFAKELVPKAFIDELRTRNGNLNIVIGDFSDRETL